MTKMNENIRVGVGIMIFNKDRKILLGKRKGSHGVGEYSFPGGHLEFGESFEKCAKREVREECGIEIVELEFQLVANVDKYSPRQDVYIGFTAKWHNSSSFKVPKVLEPEKCESWCWYDIDSLPEPLFHFCRITIDSFKTKCPYYDLIWK